VLSGAPAARRIR